MSIPEKFYSRVSCNDAFPCFRNYNLIFFVGVQGFLGKSPSGWGLFSVLISEACKNKNSTHWGFAQVSGLGFCLGCIIEP